MATATKPKVRKRAAPTVCEVPGHCTSCPFGHRKACAGRGPKNGLMLVLEAPNSLEVAHKKAPKGKAGDLLRLTLRAAGIDLEECYVTFAVSCQQPPTPKGKANSPGIKVVTACRDRLIQEIAEVNPSKILCFGGPALTAVLGEKKILPITKHRGQGFVARIPYQEVEDMWVPDPNPLEVVPGFLADPDDTGTWEKTTVTKYRDVYTMGTLRPESILKDEELFREMGDDILKWVSHNEVLPPPRIDIWEPKDVPETLEALAYICQAEAIACDIESTGFDFQTDTMFAVGFGCRTPKDPDFDGLSVVLNRQMLAEPRVKEEIRQVLGGGYRGTIVFHNGKFDLKFLWTYLGEKVRPHDTMDTMYLAYARDERPGGRYSGHSLKTLSRIFYDVAYTYDIWKDYLARPEEERDERAMLEYLALDVHITARLYHDLCQELDAESVRLVPMVRNILIPAMFAFTEVEMAGVMIDRPYLRKVRHDLALELEDLSRPLNAEWHRVFPKEEEDFNPDSPDQVKKFLNLGHGWDMETTQRDPLIFLKKRLPDDQKWMIDNIIRYRLLSKVQSTYVLGLLHRADAHDRVHPDFKLHGTATGRTSCAEPNVQNIPAIMGDIIRAAFISAPGKVFVEADYSQLEIRVLGYYAKDPVIKETYILGKDIHRIVAAKMFRKAEEDVIKADRFWAKRIDFGVIYGRGAKAIIEGAEMAEFVEQGGTPWSLEEAQFFLDEFLGEFPNVRAFIQSQKEFVLKHKYVETPLGRRRRFPCISDRAGAGRQAVNTPIQGLASDFTVTAITRIQRRLPPGASIVMSVHDSIMIECWEQDADLVKEIIEFEMQDPGQLPVETDIPFKAEAHIGTRWSEMEE